MPSFFVHAFTKNSADADIKLCLSAITYTQIR